MTIENLLKNWEIKKPYHISEIDVLRAENIEMNTWIINESYVLKKFVNPDYMSRGIDIVTVLAGERIPVAVPIKTKDKKDYFKIDKEYFCLYPRLMGNGLREHFDEEYLKCAEYIGQIIGDLHLAFIKCDGVISMKEMNLFNEVVNWAIPIANEFAEKIGVEIYEDIIKDYKSEFESIYPKLPHQLIHRDMHGGNLLFENGNLTGYIDFDLGERNVRIFDPCYMSMGILSECFHDNEKREQWISIFSGIIRGYDSICELSQVEKRAIIYILYSIELIFIAYFVQNGYPQLAESTANILNWIYGNRSRLDATQI